MKYIVTQLEVINEPISFCQEELGMCFLEADFGCYHSIPSPITLYTQLEVLPYSPDSTIVPKGSDVKWYGLDGT